MMSALWLAPNRRPLARFAAQDRIRFGGAAELVVGCGCDLRRGPLAPVLMAALIIYERPRRYGWHRLPAQFVSLPACLK